MSTTTAPNHHHRHHHHALPNHPAAEMLRSAPWNLRLSAATQPIQTSTATPDWQIELSLLERNRVYTVLSDNINWLHDIKRMPTVLGDNSSQDISFSSSNGEGNSNSLPDLFFVNNGSGNYEDNSTVGFTERVITTEHYVLIVLYTFTTLLAILGNSVAIVIFTKGKRSKTDLRPFLINLAVADLIMAIFCIPFTFTYQLLDSNWIFSRPMCPIVMFLQTVSVTGSVSTNMAIGIDRFCAIAFPLNASRNKPSRYRVIILTIWIIAIAFAGVQLFVGDTEYNPVKKHTECNEMWPSQEMSLVYTILLLILTYLLPVIILTVTYSIVGYLLWKRNLPGNADVIRDRAQLKAKSKIVKMLVTIVVLFALCWLPLHTFFFVLSFTHEKDHGSLSLAYVICHWVAMSNSFVNPIVYGSLNDSFRADLKSLFFRCIPCCNAHRRQRQGAVKIKQRAGKYHVNFKDTSSTRTNATKTYLLTSCHQDNSTSSDSNHSHNTSHNITRNGSESPYPNRSSGKYIL